MKKSILITGNAGHIGSRFADWVLSHHPEFEVVGVDSLIGGYPDVINNQVAFYKRDLSKEDIKDIFAKHSFKYVFHFAAYAAEGVSPFQRKFVLSNNVLSTANVINECINYGVERLVFTSSMSVYGQGKGSGYRFQEDDIPDPLDPYAISKYTSELDIKAAGMQHGLDWCILRPHNIYGVGQNIWDRYRNVLGIWMFQTMNSMPITIYGEGNQTRAFSYIDDCLPCLWNAATYSKASKQIINIGGKQEYTIKDTAELFMKITGQKKIIYLEPRFEVKWSVPSWEKSVRILDFEDSTNLTKGIDQMWRWSKKLPYRERLSWNHFEVEKGLYSYWRNM